ncbi:MAG TPA: PEP-CTERM sorting domain-containing protein, partial [Fimbriimonadaceae bacterium]|nr:PEP-CTERM sorting domain-containing protein [Fimbriimonadaceae bacterium]
GRVLSVGISSDRIFLGNDNTQNTLPSFMMNTNDFHTYSLRSQANTAVLSVDGSDVLSIDLGLSATSAANYVWFGDVSSAGSSSSETNYVAYNAVPEPGTLAALGLGAAALLRRRRRA